MEELRLKLDNFEGPLDLLLHLLHRKKIGIEEIEISKLIDEYLIIISKAKKDNLTIKVEFLNIAAELLEIKALSILSMREKEKKEEELGKRLREYKLFKELTEKLSEMEKIYNKPYSVGEGKKVVKTASKEFRIDKLTPMDIFKAYSRFLDEEEQETLKINIEKEYDLLEEIEGIKTFVGEKIVELIDVFKLAKTKLHLVYIFLGVLEMYKYSTMEIEGSKVRLRS